MEKIEKQSFLIGSHFSLFKSNVPLVLIPKINEKINTIKNFENNEYNLEYMIN